MALAMNSCAPQFASWIGKSESAINLPSQIDNGDRFADPHLAELEKPTEIDPSTDESFVVDTAQDNSGTLEERRARLNLRIIKNAEYVLKKESKKAGIGNACNFFLQRILELSGFSDDGYKANDFDRYANKRFTGATTAQFKVEPLRKDAKNLEKFLFSYPEGTPFILQWKTTAPNGHLAIVTRTGDQLVIYEASLGRFNAGKKLTGARKILSASARYKMIVYVNFMPSDK